MTDDQEHIAATTDDDIAAALTLLQQTAPMEPPTANDETLAAAAPLSPTLAALDINRRPPIATVCETCPNSVWFSSATEVKCYCRVMYLITWSTPEPTIMTQCDGQFIGQQS